MDAEHKPARADRRPVVVATVGLGIAIARWLAQGSANVYTDASKRFYVPDAVLQWRLADEGPLWIGLDAVGVVAGLAVATIVAGQIAVRTGQRWTAVAAWALAVAALIPGAAAFATGSPPEHAQSTRPPSLIPIPVGLEGGLPVLDAGEYVGVPREDSVVASVDAGGEVFESRFRVVSARLIGDPGDLRQPLSVEVVVAADSIDTGVDGRSKHALQYLKSEQFPRIHFRLEALSAANNETSDTVALAASGSLELMGVKEPINISARLSAGAEPASFAVDASFTVRLSETELKAQAKDFDSDEVPIRVLLSFKKKS